LLWNYEAIVGMLCKIQYQCTETHLGKVKSLSNSNYSKGYSIRVNTDQVLQLVFCFVPHLVQNLEFEFSFDPHSIQNVDDGLFVEVSIVVAGNLNKLF
jgi:hypothetical protein